MAQIFARRDPRRLHFELELAAAEISRFSLREILDSLQLPAENLQLLWQNLQLFRSPTLKSLLRRPVQASA